MYVDRTTKGTFDTHATSSNRTFTAGVIGYLIMVNADMANIGISHFIVCLLKVRSE